MRRLLIFIALSGCAPVAPGPVPGDALAVELVGRTAGAAQTCVSTMPNQGLRVINSRTLAYESGRTLWINRLKAACPAIEPYNTVIVEASAGHYCRGDRVRGIEPGATIPGPACNLDDWTPYRLP